MRQSSIATGTILSVNDLHTRHHAKTLLLPFPTLKDGGRESIPTSLNSFPQATSMRSSHYNHSPVSPIRDLLRCSFAWWFHAYQQMYHVQGHMFVCFIQKFCECMFRLVSDQILFMGSHICHKRAVNLWSYCIYFW